MGTGQCSSSARDSTIGRTSAAGAELDIVQPGTPLFEFYRLSMEATSKPLVAAKALTADEAAQLVARLDQPDFLACGFAFIGAWGRRPAQHPPA